ICKSGRHTLSDATSAERCCNGWRRELRLDGSEPSDDPQGRAHVHNMLNTPRAVYGEAVKDQLEGSQPREETRTSVSTDEQIEAAARNLRYYCLGNLEEPGDRAALRLEHWIYRDAWYDELAEAVGYGLRSDWAESNHASINGYLGFMFFVAVGR